VKRRAFLRNLGTLGLVGSIAGCKYWPEQGLRNPCLNTLPDSVARHPLVLSLWEGLDPTQVWDSHTHLVGGGDPLTGAWYSPNLDSVWHPFLRMQKAFYTNAGCMRGETHAWDQSYVARLSHLLELMPPGFKTMLFAFDWYHNEHGDIDKNRSMFFIPNVYAANVARSNRERYEWVASIHPYRRDSVDALKSAIRDGARAIKWLPSAQGIDPMSARCDDFYTAMADSKLPLICHAGLEIAVQGGHQEFGNPLRLRRAMDHGVRVVVAHCASDGNDIDIDQGPDGPSVRSYELFARMMDEQRYANLLYGDISALTQLNRNWALKDVLKRVDWHPRLLNGSDYPLPGIMPLFSATDIANMGLIDIAAVPLLQQIRPHNSLLFDFMLKRLLRFEKQGFANSVFETRKFFQPSSGSADTLIRKS